LLAESNGYLEAQRKLAQEAMQKGDMLAAWQAFGRLTHTAQDFMRIHYVALWRRRIRPAAGSHRALDPARLGSPRLTSGKVYYPWEALSFIPPLEPLMRRLLPRDSHTWMNLDAPQRGPNYAYAYVAAVKRTRGELEALRAAGNFL
jgi:hypothetical protein